MKRVMLLVGLCLLFCPPGSAQSGEEPREAAASGLRRAVEFFAQNVSSHGGYVYQCSADLKKREAEGRTDADTAWVQPPGTPAVGLALVEAYERTGQPYLLDAARAAGECLIQGQLRSGCWTDRVEFAPERRAKLKYRVDPPRKRGFNHSTFDDDKTQACLRFLSRLDQAQDFTDQRLHECVMFALDSVLRAQFPNGGWAQGWDEFPDPALFSVQPASLPEEWPRTYSGGDYWDFYTLNDNAIADTIDALLMAHQVYDDPRYRSAAIRGGEFLLLAQLPDPQPAWAQQYNFQMQPSWARKFEPPAVSGGESQGVIRALLRLYVETGDRRFIEPIPPAIAYLRRSQRPDGRLPRFLELGTNTPLYMTRQYALTYEDDDLPTHYSFIVDSHLDDLAEEYKRLSTLSSDELTDLPTQSTGDRLESPPSPEQVRAVLDALDERGAWVEDGRLRYYGKGDDTQRIITSRTFIKNVGVLSRYLAAERAD